MGHPALVVGKVKLQVPRLPPHFLSGLVASVNLVRLSIKKAAYVAVDWCSVVGNPEFARDDKGWGGASMGNWLVAERIAGRSPVSIHAFHPVHFLSGY
jgi:hypothetical protein